MNETAPPPAGAALLLRLARLGVDRVFVNSGTDFPPLIEGLAQAERRGWQVPEVRVVPFESVAVGMAHGYTLATGRPQAVMVHTNVGLANSAMALINAAFDQVPMLLCSGRTPLTEKGRPGERSNPINWGQEMRDQAALVRESVKWDYELRYPEQVPALLDRALAIACSTPRGPVYLGLPREPLCEPCPWEALEAEPRSVPALSAPPGDALDRAAELIAAAERPLILSQRGTGSAAGFEALAGLADRWAMPVVELLANRPAIPTDHPMQAGYLSADAVRDADVILVVEALVPWQPTKVEPPSGCRVIHVGQDPLYSRFPVRGHAADLALPGVVDATLAALAERLETHRAGRAAALAARHAAHAERNRAEREMRLAKAREGCAAPMSRAWVGHCVGELAEAQDGAVVAELGALLPFMTVTRPNAYYAPPTSGGLGWGLPAALGLQLADRERLVIATVGDGSYLFSNPVACHQVAEAAGLPLLTVVLNNGAWDACRTATLDLYPDGAAAQASPMPLTSLAPSPDYTLVAAASRAHVERVTDGAELPAALERALRVIREERRQALVEVATRPGTV